MKISTISTTVVAIIIAPTSAFIAPTSSETLVSPSMGKGLQLSMFPSHQSTLDVGKVAIVGACILSNVLTPNVASATEENVDFGPTNTIISARAGGRMGGRAMGGRSMGGYSRPMGGSYRSYSSRTYITPPPLMISPFGMGFGYNPLGGIGLGYGLGAANSAGNEMRDYNQETEIQRDRAELEQAKQKNADLEARLELLEKAQ